MATYTLFVIISMSIILVSLIIIKVPVLETFEGNFEGERVIINEVVDYSVSNIYVYKTRSSNLEKYKVLSSTVIENNYTVLYVEIQSDYERMDGVVKIDAEKKQVPLLFVILGIENKYI